MSLQASNLFAAGKTFAAEDSFVAAGDTIRYDVDIVSPQELCGELAAHWIQIRNGSNDFDSPYFDIEFTKAVSRVRDDVQVAVIREGQQVVGFLPWQTSSAKTAVPVGGRLNDCHGVIGRSNEQIIRQVLRKAGLSAYAFHSITNAPASLENYLFRHMQAHHLDLSQGWDHYRKWVRKHSSTVKRQGQKTRNLEKEIGPIRFEFDCQSADVLESLIDLKRARYQRSKTFDILSVEWAADLLREIHTMKLAGFQGLLSVLWAGDKLIAVHFGMLTDRVLHYWFPVYAPEYHRFSPGTELIMQVAEQAARRGVGKLDLGYGDDAYKFKFCNGKEPVACGRVGFSKLGFEIAKRRYEIRNQLKLMPLKPVVKKMLRGVYPGFGQWNFK